MTRLLLVRTVFYFAIFFACAREPNPVAAQMPSPVVVAPIVTKQVAAGQTFVGTVQPKRRSAVGSAVDGRLIDMFVEAGTPVTKDQPLAQILTKTLEIEIAGAKAELELRKQELEEMQNGSLPEELAQAKSKLAAAQALSTYAQAKYQRTLGLFQQGKAVNQEELDQAHSMAVNATQGAIAAQAAFDLAQQGPRKEKVAQAQAKFAAQQEAVNYLEDRLKKFTLRAPFDGFVVTKQVEVGQWISQAQIVAEVIELATVEIHVSIPETYIDNLQTAVAQRTQANDSLPARVQVEALPRETVTGIVSRIVPQADTRTRTFPVIIQVANPRIGDSHLLKAGMLARVTLPVDKPQDALFVPKDALVLGGPAPIVFVIDNGPMPGMLVAKAVPVQLGIAEHTAIQIFAPLKPGQKVVIRGNERLRPDQPVRIAEGM